MKLWEEKQEYSNHEMEVEFGWILNFQRDIDVVDGLVVGDQVDRAGYQHENRCGR